MASLVGCGELYLGTKAQERLLYLADIFTSVIISINERPRNP